MEMIPLGIQDEIFEEFFKKLAESKLPEDLIRELKTLVEKGEIGTKERILEVIKRGV
jgi:hypothetical protein